MWTFWPVVITAFLAAFSLGHEQVRTGCNTSHPAGLVCRTSDIAQKPLDLGTVRNTSEKVLNRSMIKGAAIEDFAWNETKAGETGMAAESREYPFSIGIVEYDDQGRAWSDAQVEAVKGLVSGTLASQDALIVTFIHGWKNNCTTCNGNLACFREVLALLSGVERDLARVVQAPPRPIVGIYIGWRGKTMRIPIADSLSAFSRKTTADRVGGRTSDVTSFLSWLNEAKVRVNLPTPRSPLGSRLIVVGHSFGADVLFGAIAGHLSAQLGASTVDGSGLHATAFADLTVLVDPALEASAYHRFDVEARQKFAKGQLPLLVTVQATNDQVTHVVFPIERALMSLADSAASKQDYGASLATIGHYAPYYTHSLCQPGRPGCVAGAEASEATRLQKFVISPPKTPCGCDSFQASRDAHAVLLRSVRHALEPRPDTDVHIGDSLAGLASDLELIGGDRPANVDSPFLVVRAEPDIVDKHSGLYRGQFFDFLTNMIIRVQFLENQGLRSQILRELRIQ